MQSGNCSMRARTAANNRTTATHNTTNDTNETNERSNERTLSNDNRISGAACERASEQRAKVRLRVYSSIVAYSEQLATASIHSMIFCLCVSVSHTKPYFYTILSSTYYIYCTHRSLRVKLAVAPCLRMRCSK